MIIELIKMEKEIEARLKELKEEYQKGQERLIALDQEATNLRNTMLRISGAIQVLEELIGNGASANSDDGNPDIELTKKDEKQA
jgi:predicted nuclease with TOPRIM domain